ncbi:MAG: hypothetical protein JWN02_2091 [Acidobacteria bacterium]|jgi:hypothetical protein|nr:hypothetical protein [Acidobacteriota bacterium]
MSPSTLLNTLVLSATDATTAQSDFDKELKKSKLLFCINGADQSRIATFADDIAGNGGAESPWGVVWIKNPALVAAVVAAFPRVQDAGDPASGVAFSLSFGRQVADVMINDPAVINDDDFLRARIFKSFVLATGTAGGAE